MKAFALGLAGLILLALGSCAGRSAASQREERELALLIEVLGHPAGDGRSEYLTPTPFKNWDKGWTDFPPATHRALAAKGLVFGRGSEVAFVDGWITEKATGRRGWLKWCTITWDGPDTVTVDTGTWTTGLGGGGGTRRYRWADGVWKLIESGPFWVS